MRMSIPAVVAAALFAVLVAAPASATVEIADRAPQITQQSTAPAASLNLELVQVPSYAERVAAEEAAAAAQPTRTSWWWLVAAIVVAGIIVGVLVA